jgi:hypothetical protein
VGRLVLNECVEGIDRAKELQVYLLAVDVLEARRVGIALRLGFRLSDRVVETSSPEQDDAVFDQRCICIEVPVCPLRLAGGD